MTSLFLGQILVKMAETTPAAKPETTLEPIRPGAWATWAKAARDEDARAETATPSPASQQRRLTFHLNHR
jgi:hypothetical protein